MTSGRKRCVKYHCYFSCILILFNWAWLFLFFIRLILHLTYFFSHFNINVYGAICSPAGLKTEIPCILASYQTWICLLIYCFYSHKCTISHISIFKILVTFEPVPEYMFNISNFKTYFLGRVKVNVILILYFFI
uniref:G_PROTEIN_RECEP_F1_2 domain-containing protein n=1 Tax=Heterorhabditis bacteriophora TaxID=37862 RepID=A0A1I7WEZ0_HETBA